MKTVDDVMPIRSDAEYRQVQQAIRTVSEEAESDVREQRLLALRQRAEAYERRLRVDPERLRALEELAAQAQDLKMGYD